MNNAQLVVLAVALIDDAIADRPSDADVADVAAFIVDQVADDPRLTGEDWAAVREPRYTATVSAIVEALWP